MNNLPNRTSDNDLFTLLLISVLGLGAAVGALAATWGRALVWLLEHQVVVSASAHPLLVLPGSDGAGLDPPRLALAIAAALLLAAATAGAARRRRLAVRAGLREPS